MGDRIPFYKLSGAGNDFIALVEPAAVPGAEAIRAWCRRGLSIGADGLLVLSRTEGGRVRLSHWNADGSPSDLCLNGSRCCARLACELGWHESRRVRLITDAGPLESRWLAADKIEIRVPWKLERPVARRLATPSGAFDGHAISVGVPHFVLALDAPPGDFDLPRLGPLLRHHEDLGPQGANIDIVRWMSRHRVDLRTFERGVEGETLACGTGAIAAVRVGAELDALDRSVTVSTLGGFELEVYLHQDGIRLAGDARIISSGEIWFGG